ncbi:MAG: DUF7282 domain-containing protein [Halobacteriota archaeon]|uniref:DUF7282 domain-containing protein n=1 Tax=Natronomonas sp. TaxID=2184060 RepID=UPI003976214F
MDASTTKLLALAMAAIILVPAVGVISAQEQPPTTNVSDAAVSFSDQTTDGTTVTVDSVNTTDGGFVTIHDSTLLEGEVLGSVIGVSEFLEPGLNENVTVTLFDVPGAEFDRTALTENETLIAMPHRDTNDNGTYDFVATESAEDGPYFDGDDPVTDAANVTVLTEQTSDESFTVSDLSAPASVEQGESANISAMITNPNDVVETQSVEYRFDGEVLVREEVSLEANESTNLSMTLDTSDVEVGDSIHGVYTRESGIPAQIAIVEEIDSFSVSELTAPVRVTAGETVSVNATITNPNEFAAEQPVQFRFNGALLETQDVSLDGNGSAPVEFTVDTEELEPGTYIHSVFTIDFGQDALITIEAADDEPPVETPNGSDGPPTETPEDGDENGDDTTETPTETPEDGDENGDDTTETPTETATDTEEADTEE